MASRPHQQCRPIYLTFASSLCNLIYTTLYSLPCHHSCICPENDRRFAVKQPVHGFDGMVIRSMWMNYIRLQQILCTFGDLGRNIPPRTYLTICTRANVIHMHSGIEEPSAFTKKEPQATALDICSRARLQSMFANACVITTRSGNISL